MFVKVGSQFCQILNTYSRNGQRQFKIRPKCLNFTKDGHTELSTYLSLLTFPIQEQWAAFGAVLCSADVLPQPISRYQCCKTFFYHQLERKAIVF